VSSTAHLYLAQSILGIRNDEMALSFDVLLHLGTALALIVATRRELIAMIQETARWIRGRPAADPAARAMLIPLVVGTVPGVLAGLLLLRRFEEMRTLLVIGITMLIACGYFFFAEGIADRRRGRERDLADLRLQDGLWIGVAQAAAGLLAGLSRSGLTIATGKLRRLNRPDAARFSFLLALPIILGAGAKALLDLRKVAEPTMSGSVLLVGFVASAVVGYLAIEFMLKFVRTHSLRPFGIYLAALGLVLILTAVFPGLVPFSAPR